MKAYPYKSLQVSAGGGPVPRVRALIFNEAGEILLVQHPARALADGDRPAFWALPGGKIDALEGSFGALRRELDEELGLEVPDLRLRFVIEMPFINSVEFFYVGTLKEYGTEGMDKAVKTGELAAVAFKPFGAADLFKPARLASLSREDILAEGVSYLGIWED